jgi:hypothetical protein
MNFELDLSEDTCPICQDKKYKAIIDALLLKNISPEAIVKYLLESQGTRFSVSDIKIHKDNHFKVREQNAFRFVEKQEEMKAIFERYKSGQQKSIVLIDTLNMTMEQMIARTEEIFSDPNRNASQDKNILGYMKEIRMTTDSLAKLKGELSGDSNINVNVIRNEAEPIIEAIKEVVDELSPQLRDKFLLRLSEKLKEVEDDEEN